MVFRLCLCRYLTDRLNRPHLTHSSFYYLFLAISRMANKVERRGPKTIDTGEISGGKRSQPNRDIAGKFVQSYRNVGLARASQVNFHYHGHWPDKALVDAQQNV